jgi:hypothetical protein
LVSEGLARLRRWLVLGGGVAAVAVLCAAAILLMNTRADESTPQEAAGSSSSSGAPAEERSTINGLTVLTGEEALVADARSYAKDMGVSLEEAIRRLKMQGGRAPSEVERELKRSERDAYAGLWIRHRPDYGITVAAARDFEAVEEKARSQVEGTKWEGTIRIRPVEASLVELNTARAEADRIFEQLGISASSGENLSKNRIEFYVKDETEFESKLRASGLELPDHVVVVEGMETTMPG